MSENSNDYIKYQEETMKLYKLLLQLKEKIVLTDLKETEIKYIICEKIIEKIVNLIEGIMKEKDLMLLVSCLRYVFETLVTTKLFIVEPNYIYKVYYSIYMHQEKKMNNIIKKAQKECKLLIKLEQEEKDIMRKYIKNEEYMIKSIFNTMNDKAKEEITLFFGNVELNGFGYQQSLIQNKILPKYQQRLKEIKELKDKQSKIIAKSEKMNIEFDIRNQSNRVFKQLSDKRKWSEKAQDVGLLEEYNLMYELTSSLIHCTSYSLFTSNYLESEDLFVMYRQLTQYLEKILQNIKKLCNIA